MKCDNSDPGCVVTIQQGRSGEVVCCSKVMSSLPLANNSCTAYEAEARVLTGLSSRTEENIIYERGGQFRANAERSVFSWNSIEDSSCKTWLSYPKVNGAASTI